MENRDLRELAIGSLSEVLHKRFSERKMTGKLRREIAGDMASIAANAFRIGYYAYARKMGIKVTAEQFNAEHNDAASEVERYLIDLTWRIQDSGR